MINCTFVGNAAKYGGGMYNRDGSPTVYKCTFFNNKAGISGGGMCNKLEGAPTVVACTFAHNMSVQAGGGMFNGGPGHSIITNCLFTENTSRYLGGGMFNDVESDPSLIGCVFTGNSAIEGGAVASARSDPNLINCIFVGNHAINNAAAVYNYRSAPTLVNCVIAHNSAGSNGGGVYDVDSCTPRLRNCILWGNRDSGGTDEEAQVYSDDALGVNTPTVDYSCVQGWTGVLGGTGNIGDNPIFLRNPDDGGDGWGDDPWTPGVDEGTNDDYGDLHLQDTSPCIDAGDNGALPADVADLDNDGDIEEPVPFDLDGNPRVVNGVVDMGAYERQPLAAHLDIEPGQCPNRFNVHGGGSVRMAVVGDGSFDVALVDPDSLVLRRADGVGGSVAPGAHGHWDGVALRDVTTPFDGEACDCDTQGRDGVQDLVFWISRRQMVDELQLGSAESGDEIMLTLRSVLVDGTEFAASDCVKIIGHGHHGGRHRRPR